MSYFERNIWANGSSYSAKPKARRKKKNGHTAKGRKRKEKERKERKGEKPWKMKMMED